MSGKDVKVRDNLQGWLVLVAMAVIPVAALGQERGGREVYEEQLRVALDKQLPEAREVSVDAGGWFNFALMIFDDAAADRDRALRQFQLRVWGSANVRGVHRAYVRGLLSYDDWESGDNPTFAHGDDYDEDVERAWYQFDLGQMLRNQTGEEPAVGFKFKVGREFMTIGTALALSMPLDMIQLTATTVDWEIMALLGNSRVHSNNIDDSEAVADQQDRLMWGGQVTYRGLDRHRPFVYFLGNRDHTDPEPPSTTQSYGYDSRYVGLGSEGTVLSPDLRYQVEVVGEWGRTYSDGVVWGRDRISAMAIDALLEYSFRHHMQPKVKFEYIFGSGDRDRGTSATATIGGNLAGTKDHAFNAFGFRDTGIAFSPRISNIHIYNLNASFFPLEKVELFRKMEMGSQVFFYQKARRSGAISDTTAANAARWVGWEWDVYCNWRLTSDLAWTMRYGAFQPGSAFDGGDKSWRQFLYTGIVFSF